MFSQSISSSILHFSSFLMSQAASSAAAPARRVLVIGGNGYVGSHVCKELVARKQRGKDGPLTIASVSRSGLPPANAAPWVREVQWLKGDPLAPQSGEFAS